MNILIIQLQIYTYIFAALLQARIPLTQCQRYRGKINIQRPRAPHYERAKVLHVTKPILPEPVKTRTCFQPTKERLAQQIESPYNAIIAREVRNWLDHSQMVAIFHLNSMAADDLFRVRVQLHKQNIHLKSYGKKIISEAVAGSKYEAIVPLFDSSHCIVFSSEQRVAALIRLTRKVPQMILLGGIVDNTLLSRNELVNYARMPSLPIAQAELVNTLQLAAGVNLVKQLETHQNNFANILDVYAKSATDSEKEPVDEKVADSTATAPNKE